MQRGEVTDSSYCVISRSHLNHEIDGDNLSKNHSSQSVVHGSLAVLGNI